MRINIMGVGFDSLTLSEAVDCAQKLIVQRRAAYVVTPNPEIVMTCWENADAMEAVQHADLVLPDGVGVVYGARILGTPLKGKLPGIDFATELMRRMASNGGRVFLLGAKPGVAETAGERMQAQFPGLIICGTHDGYFQDDAPVIEEINALQPDLLLVCLGAPKQELWMRRKSRRFCRNSQTSASLFPKTRSGMVLQANQRTVALQAHDEAAEISFCLYRKKASWLIKKGPRRDPVSGFSSRSHRCSRSRSCCRRSCRRSRRR